MAYVYTSNGKSEKLLPTFAFDATKTGLPENKNEKTNFNLQNP